MTEIIGVRFKKTGKIYYFSPAGIKAEEGTLVIVETARGVECGEVVMPNRSIDDSQITAPLKEIIRIVTPQDMKILSRTGSRKRTLSRYARKKFLPTSLI